MDFSEIIQWIDKHEGITAMIVATILLGSLLMKILKHVIILKGEYCK